MKRYFDVAGYLGASKSFQSQFVTYFHDCKKVLEIGCGKGEFLTLLKEKNIPCVGYDPLKECRKFVEEKGIEFINTLPLDFKKYDGLYMCMVIEHMKLEEINNILSKFIGRIVLITDDMRAFKFCIKPSFWDDFQHIKPYTPKSLERLLIYHNFSIERIFRPKYPLVTSSFYGYLNSMVKEFVRASIEKIWGIMDPFCIVAGKNI